MPLPVFNNQSDIDVNRTIKNKIIPMAMFKEIPKEAKSDTPNIA